MATRRPDDWARALLDASPDAIYVWSFEGRILDCNQAAIEQSGRSRDEILRASARELDADLGPEAWQIVDEVTRMGASLVRHTRHRRGDGTLQPVASHMRDLLVDGERLLMVVERVLGPAGPPEERRAEVAREGAAALLLLDEHGQIATMTPEAEQVFGVDATARGRPFEPFTTPPLAALVAGALRRARSRRQLSLSGPERCAARRGDGSIFAAEVALAPLEAGGQPAVAVVLRDLEREAMMVAAALPVLERIVGRSRQMARLREQIETVAATDTTVLILGETGAGKELVADALHALGPRRGGPLVKLNCAALPAGLVASELFGHERGAFTGAVDTRLGRFEAARGGTLFLDEIGDLPLDLQATLLRVMQERRLERLGSLEPIDVDVRLVAATHRDLRAAVRGGQFRDDLYFRLAVVVLRVPPLRERPEDIPDLVQHFVRRACAQHGRFIQRIPEDVLARLCAHDWPGNVRELANLVGRAVILGRSDELQLEDGWLPAAPAGRDADAGEAERIRAALEAHGWRVSGARGAARALGLKATTLEARMKRLGIQRPGSR